MSETHLFNFIFAKVAVISFFVFFLLFFLEAAKTIHKKKRFLPSLFEGKRECSFVQKNTYSGLGENQFVVDITFKQLTC